MARARTVHRCEECGAVTTRWAGRCPTCGAWNALVEEIDLSAGPRRTSGGPAAPPGWLPGLGDRPVRMAEVEAQSARAVPTGMAELDRVLDGGLVPGSVTLVAGEPGTGKSTLLLQAAGALAASGRRALVVSGEESKAQVQARARRLGTLSEGLWVASETCLPDIMAAMAEVEPHLCIIDSIQTVHDPALESAPGSVAQVRHCAQRLVATAKEAGTAVVMVGHVTKEGSIAGPRLLEHVVDTVLTFEGERHQGLRLLRAVKHRFGPTGELGLFEMAGAGLVEVADPSAHLLGDRRPGISGSLVLPAMEGGRPLLVEVQSLVMEAGNPAMARRSAQGLEAGRIPMLLAVLERRADLKLASMDVYVSVVGGVRVSEPAADLAVLLSIASAHQGGAVADDTVVFGEVGLGGEVRQVVHTPRRLAEAQRLGFRRAVVPASVTEGPPGLVLERVTHLVDAIERVAAS
ncbi:MAG: DNA repair protein RadA [Acidimicrobiales bacterium]